MRIECTARVLGIGIDDPCAPKGEHCLGNSLSTRSMIHLDEIGADAVVEMGSQSLALTTGETSRAGPFRAAVRPWPSNPRMDRGHGFGTGIDDLSKGQEV